MRKDGARQHLQAIYRQDRIMLQHLKDASLFLTLNQGCLRLQKGLTSVFCCKQVLCNEAGMPIHEMRDDDVAARELTLDSKMRAFFRLSNFSHRCELNQITYAGSVVGNC